MIPYLIITILLVLLIIIVADKSPDKRPHAQVGYSEKLYWVPSYHRDPFRHGIIRKKLHADNGFIRDEWQHGGDNIYETKLYEKSKFGLCRPGATFTIGFYTNPTTYVYHRYRVTDNGDGTIKATWNGQKPTNGMDKPIPEPTYYYYPEFI